MVGVARTYSRLAPTMAHIDRMLCYVMITCNHSTANLIVLLHSSYPNRLYERIDTYAKVTRTHSAELAIDVACGTGQATIGLRKYYDNVFSHLIMCVPLRGQMNVINR
jgi:SAM-dependent methyltransferase